MRTGLPLTLLILLVALIGSATTSAADLKFDPEAVRLNNRGVAQMGQQFTDRAATTFGEAFKKDPRLTQAEINQGIALLYLQKVDEAKAALKSGLESTPNSARGWYNLGLAQHADNEREAALESFQHVVAIDPHDADSYYYQGVCYQELKQFDKAIDQFTKALEVNPLHASSEFAMARALQRSGRAKDAAPHYQRFLHLTGDKISRRGRPFLRRTGALLHSRTCRRAANNDCSLTAGRHDDATDRCAISKGRLYRRRVPLGCERYWCYGPGHDA